MSVDDIIESGAGRSSVERIDVSDDGPAAGLFVYTFFAGERVPYACAALPCLLEEAVLLAHAQTWREADYDAERVEVIGASGSVLGSVPARLRDLAKLFVARGSLLAVGDLVVNLRHLVYADVAVPVGHPLRARGLELLGLAPNEDQYRPAIVHVVGRTIDRAWTRRFPTFLRRDDKVGRCALADTGRARLMTNLEEPWCHLAHVGGRAFALDRLEAFAVVDARHDEVMALMRERGEAHE